MYKNVGTELRTFQVVARLKKEEKGLAGLALAYCLNTRVMTQARVRE
jgi:hypothetical protein